DDRVHQGIGQSFPRRTEMRPLVALPANETGHDDGDAVDVPTADAARPDTPWIVVPAGKLAVISKVGFDEVAVQDPTGDCSLRATVLRWNGGAFLCKRLRCLREEQQCE